MTQTLPPGITQQEIDRLARLDAATKAALREVEALKKKVKKAYAGQTGTFVCGKVILKLTESIILNTETFAEAFPFSEYPEYYTAKVDVSKVPDDAKAEHFKLQTSLSVSMAEEPATLQV